MTLARVYFYSMLKVGVTRGTETCVIYRAKLYNYMLTSCLLIIIVENISINCSNFLLARHQPYAKTSITQK